MRMRFLFRFTKIIANPDIMVLILELYWFSGLKSLKNVLKSNKRA